MAMVMLDARPSTGSCSLANRVSIVEAKQAHAAFIVQRQRVGETMRAFRCRWHPSHREFDPMQSRLVGEECFPIEKQESIKTLVAICHTGKLSTLDNQVKVIFAFSASFWGNAARVSMCWMVPLLPESTDGIARRSRKDGRLKGGAPGAVG